VSFVFACEFALVRAVGIAAMNRRNPVFIIPLPRLMGRYRTTIEGVSDARIADALVGSKKNSRTSDRLSTALPVRNERFEFGTFIPGEIDGVLLVRHTMTNTA
jgi:hypothetical protein